MSLTVVCVFVRGPYPYTPEYVTRLERMVRRYAPSCEFICLTDQPEAFALPIRTIRIPNEVPGCPGAIGYWNKLQLFNPEHGFSGRMLFLDLDTLVVGDLAEIVNYPATFALCECEMAREKPAREIDSKGRAIIRRFNASVMVWDAPKPLPWGMCPSHVAYSYQGDQDYYADLMPEASAMPAAWFPRLSRIAGPPFHPDAKVVLSKKPKNHLAVAQYPWFEPLWGGWAA